MKTMKTYHKKKKIIRYRPAHRYPNAADKRYYLDRFADGILSVATACGAVTIFAFLAMVA